MGYNLDTLRVLLRIIFIKETDTCHAYSQAHGTLLSCWASRSYSMGVVLAARRRRPKSMFIRPVTTIRINSFTTPLQKKLALR